MNQEKKAAANEKNASRLGGAMEGTPHCRSAAERAANEKNASRLGGAIDIVIPIYQPDGRLRELLEMLIRQSVRPNQILLVNTEKEFFDPSLLDSIEKSDPSAENALPNVRVEHIRKMQFDHGGTRHWAASLLHGEMILFMTQDAVPQDTYLIERLLQTFENPQVCAAYARQLPRRDCNVLERYSRGFNYPAQSRVKSAADLPELGIKTYFCSNVCAMYRRSTYEELGGFERRTIFNEDMIFAGKLIQAGKSVAYCADAKVIHSHNYTGLQQFHRNFDMGVSQAEHPEIFSGVPSEKEGIRLVKKTAGYVMQKRRPWLLFPLVWQSGCKYIGYRLGKNYRRLPKRLVLACSMNKEYWRKQQA